jgi:hypothetical protein
LIPESSEWCRLLCTQDEVQRLKAKAAQVRTNFCTSFENLKNAENDQWIPQESLMKNCYSVKFLHVNNRNASY